MQPLLHSHLLIHAEIYIYMLDTYRRNDNRRNDKDRRSNKRRMKENAGMKDAWSLLYNYIYLFLYFKSSQGLFKGLHVRGYWIPIINFIFWPHCYDRHVVSFLFSCCSTRGLGLTLLGVSESPLGRVWPSLPHLVSNSLEFYWQLLWDLNSTELNNNSTPTRSPTGSLKSNV